jgi:hypothetical protein
MNENQHLAKFVTNIHNLYLYIQDEAKTDDSPQNASVNQDEEYAMKVYLEKISSYVDTLKNASSIADLRRFVRNVAYVFYLFYKQRDAFDRQIKGKIGMFSTILGVFSIAFAFLLFKYIKTAKDTGRLKHISVIRNIVLILGFGVTVIYFLSTQIDILRKELAQPGRGGFAEYDKIRDKLSGALELWKEIRVYIQSTDSVNPPMPNGRAGWEEKINALKESVAGFMAMYKRVFFDTVGTTTKTKNMGVIKNYLAEHQYIFDKRAYNISSVQFLEEKMSKLYSLFSINQYQLDLLTKKYNREFNTDTINRQIMPVLKDLRVKLDTKRYQKVKLLEFKMTPTFIKFIYPEFSEIVGDSQSLKAEVFSNYVQSISSTDEKIKNRELFVSNMISLFMLCNEEMIRDWDNKTNKVSVPGKYVDIDVFLYRFNQYGTSDMIKHMKEITDTVYNSLNDELSRLEVDDQSTRKAYDYEKRNITAMWILFATVSAASGLNMYKYYKTAFPGKQSFAKYIEDEEKLGEEEDEEKEKEE